MKTVPITAQQAQAIANLFLSDRLGDRFTADQPRLTATCWQVPIILTYPFIGAIGEVGKVLVALTSDQIIWHTDFDEMKATGFKLYTLHQDEIQAAFS